MSTTVIQSSQYDGSPSLGRRIRQRAVEGAAIAVFLACVGLVARHTRSFQAPPDASSYHDAVRTAVQNMPRELGEWAGVDIPIPMQAQNVLKPNAFLSRKYVNRATGESCIVTIVHVGDARNMLDHYPPNCYPGQGWVLRSGTPRDVQVSAGTVHASEYEFARDRFGIGTVANVTNAMLLPNGTTAADMGGVERAMSSPELRFLGVAQIQVFFDAAIEGTRRREIVNQMVEAHVPCITAIVKRGRLSS